MTHDVRAAPPARDAFDLVHARALLEHIPERTQVLANMRRALRPGGWLVVEDVVFPPRVTDPPLRILTRVDAALRAFLTSRGADPDYGIKLPAALEDAGFIDVHCEARVPVVRWGTSDSDLLALTLTQLRPSLQADGQLSAADIDEVLLALGTARRTALSAIMVAAWGQRQHRPPASSRD